MPVVLVVLDCAHCTNKLVHFVVLSLGSCHCAPDAKSPGMSSNSEWAQRKDEENDGRWNVLLAAEDPWTLSGSGSVTATISTSTVLPDPHFTDLQPPERHHTSISTA